MESPRVASITKRILDLALGLPILLLAAPLIAAAALAIKFESGQILRQHFAANPAAAEEWRLTQKLQRDPRVTGLGRFLRVAAWTSCLSCGMSCATK